MSSFSWLLRLQVLTKRHPVRKNEKTRWDANSDRIALKGEWKVVENNDCAIDPADNASFLRFLFIKDTVLQIEEKKFYIEETYIKGIASNDMNKIQYVPERWLNTKEPKLRFSFAGVGKTDVSYVVTKDTLSLRYPANSCSRSGVRITLKRQK